MTRNTGAQRRDPITTPSMAPVSTIAPSLSVSIPDSRPESTLNLPVTGSEEAGITQSAHTSDVHQGIETSYAQHTEGSYKVKVQVRKDFRSPLSARKAGWNYISTFCETEITLSFRVQAHDCPASEPCQVFLSRLHEVHSYALEQERRSCPSNGVVRATLKPFLVAKVGPPTSDDHPLAFLSSQRILVGEREGLFLQRGVSTSRPDDGLEEHASTNDPRDSIRSIEEQGSFGAQLVDGPQQTVIE
jgi:hypothetical protein